MARKVRTALKSTAGNKRGLEIVETYRTIERKKGEPLFEFVARYVSGWRRAHYYGVKEYEGIMRLVDALPDPWKTWAKETAEPFTWHVLPEYIRAGDMREFVKALTNAIIDTKTGVPPMDSDRPSSSKRTRTEDDDLYFLNEEDESEDKDEDEDETQVVDKQMNETALVVRDEPARNDEDEEDPSEDEA